MAREVIRRYRLHYSRREFRLAVMYSAVLFALSTLFADYAINFATERASGGVTDLILSNTPAYDVDGLFVYGTFVFIALIVALLAVHPKRTPFTLYALSVFFFIRSAFTALTHLGPFATSAPLDLSINLGTMVGKIFSGGDFFFSAHTGTPFLMALVFWEERPLRYIFLGWSVFFGAVVLLGHLHYSIDVFSAFFITYTIYHIALWLFPKERALFLTQE